MALQSSQTGAAGVPDRWLLTRSVAQDEKLPGTLLLPEGRVWLNISRVVFLIPNAPVQIESVMRLLQALDVPHKTQIVLAELSGSHRDRARRRNIETLTETLQQTYPATQRERLYEPDWLAAMRAFSKRHDLLITAEGLHQPVDAIAEQPLSQALLNMLQLPILEVSGIYYPWPMRLLSWLKHSLYNIFPFVLVAAFFWVQTQIGKLAQGWVGTFAISATVIFEFAIIFVWSQFLD